MNNVFIECRCDIEDEYCPLHDCLCTEIENPYCPIHRKTPKRYYKDKPKMKINKTEQGIASALGYLLEAQRASQCKDFYSRSKDLLFLTDSINKAVEDLLFIQNLKEIR